MAYRKPYYRKDGTYVSGSFDRRNSRSSKAVGDFVLVTLIFGIIALLIKFIKVIFKGIKMLFMYLSKKLSKQES